MDDLPGTVITICRGAGCSLEQGDGLAAMFSTFLVVAIPTVTFGSYFELFSVSRLGGGRAYTFIVIY